MSILKSQLLAYLGNWGFTKYVTATYDPEHGGVNILFEDETETQRAAEMLMELPEVSHVVIVGAHRTPVLQVALHGPAGDQGVPAPRVGA